MPSNDAVFLLVLAVGMLLAGFALGLWIGSTAADWIFGRRCIVLGCCTRREKGGTLCLTHGRELAANCNVRSLRGLR